MRVCIIINLHIIWKDIIKNAFMSCSDIQVDIIFAKELTNKPYDHMIVLGNPDNIAENLILNYISRNSTYLYYMGYVNSICNTAKYLKYNDVFIFQESYNRSFNLKIMELQRYLGTSKVHVISNPIYLYDFPPITNRVTYRYGLVTDRLDENQILSLSSITEIYIGVLNHEVYDKIDEYCDNRGMNNVKVYIVDTLDSFHNTFNTCERMICEDDMEIYIPLCEACKLMLLNSDITTYEIERLKKISQNRSTDFRTLLLTLSNNIDRYTDLTLSQTLEGEYKTYHTNALQGKKINTTYGPYSHLSIEGGVNVIHDLVDLFDKNQDISLTYSKIPIDYPWIGILNQYNIDLFTNVWFQSSLKTCMGFITYSPNIRDEVKNKLETSFLGIYSTIHVETMFPSIPTYKHISKHHNKLVAVGGNIGSIFSFNRLQGYDKFYYGFTLPNIIPTKGSYISDIISMQYPNTVYYVKEPEKSPVRDEKFWKMHKDIISCKPIDTFCTADVLYTNITEDEHYSFILIYAIIHCIPIIINKTNLSVSLLGDSYPLYYDSSNIICNINQAREYLKTLELTYPIRLEDTVLYSKLY